MKSETKTHVAWLNSEQAAEYLGFTSMRAFYQFLHVNKPRSYRLGKRLRFRQADLDAMVEVVPEEKPFTLLAGGKR
jgi:excisionase family DNA binding protein